MVTKERKLEVLKKMLCVLDRERKKVKKIYPTLCVLFREYLEEGEEVSDFKDFNNMDAFLWFGADWTSKNAFWWSVRPFDFENRMRFLVYMIFKIETGQEGE